jgi:hypothetical protein
MLIEEFHPVMFGVFDTLNWLAMLSLSMQKACSVDDDRRYVIIVIMLESLVGHLDCCLGGNRLDRKLGQKA